MPKKDFSYQIYPRRFVTLRKHDYNLYQCRNKTEFFGLIEKKTFIKLINLNLYVLKSAIDDAKIKENFKFMDNYDISSELSDLACYKVVSIIYDSPYMKNELLAEDLKEFFQLYREEKYMLCLNWLRKNQKIIHKILTLHKEDMSPLMITFLKKIIDNYFKCANVLYTCDALMQNKKMNGFAKLFEQDEYIKALEYVKILININNKSNNNNTTQDDYNVFDTDKLLNALEDCIIPDNVKRLLERLSTCKSIEDLKDEKFDNDNNNDDDNNNTGYDFSILDSFQVYILENFNQIMPNIIKFSESIDTEIANIKCSCPGTMEAFNTIIDKIAKYLTEKNYPELMNKIFDLNTIFPSFIVNMITVLFNITYLLCSKQNVAQQNFEKELDNLSVHLLMTAVQRVVLHPEADNVYLYKACDHFKIDFKPFDAVVSKLQNRVKESVRDIYRSSYMNNPKPITYKQLLEKDFMIKREDFFNEELQEDCDKIYQTWIDKQVLAANICKNLKLPDTMGQFIPYLMTIKYPNIIRMKSYSKFIIEKSVLKDKALSEYFDKICKWIMNSPLLKKNLKRTPQTTEEKIKLIQSKLPYIYDYIVLPQFSSVTKIGLNDYGLDNSNGDIMALIKSFMMD